MFSRIQATENSRQCFASPNRSFTENSPWVLKRDYGLSDSAKL